MNKKIILLARLAVFAGYLQSVVADGQMQDSTYAKLPHSKFLLSLTDFDTYIVDKRMGELYFALIKPPAFTPDINYKSFITRVSGTPNYTQQSFGETPEVNAKCARGSTHLSPTGTDKALFYRENSLTTVQAMWSSSPSKYVWSMRCSNYYPGKKKCLFNESSFGVYIHGDTQDDVPMALIVEDLCRATGIKFGAEKFKWFFSFGENTLCG